MQHISLEEVLNKADILNVSLKDMKVVHLDDEPFVLEDTQRELAPILGQYIPFEDPKEAFEYIIANSKDIDFLILDQFLTRNFAQIKNYQGTDILKKLQEQHIIIPSVIFSGDHAKAEGFAILNALNRATSLAEFKESVILERKGMTSPISYVPKLNGTAELLLNIIGLSAMKREFIDRGYEDFFSTFESPVQSPKYDYVKLAYEKAMTLFNQARKFSEKFAAEISPEANPIDPNYGKPFSESLLEKCGFKYGIKYTPEEILSFSENEMVYFSHEFARTFRSVFPDSGELFQVLNYYAHLMIDMNDYYNSLDDGFHKSSKLLKYLAGGTPEQKKAAELIDDFQKSMYGLGYELVVLRDLFTNSKRYLSFGNPSAITEYIPNISYESPELKNSEIFTDEHALCFLVSEIQYNSEKIAKLRNIPLDLTCEVSALNFGQLPDRIRRKFQEFDLSIYYSSSTSAFPELETSDFLKFSISDNAGGFDRPVEHYLKEGVSGTGSSGKGLGLIMDSQPSLFYAIDLINRPGEGVTYDLYFVKSQN